MTLFETPSKQVSESRKLTADFVGKLASGVTISAVAASQSVYSGATSALTLGAASVSGSQVTASVSGGTAGVLYQVNLQATLSDGQVLRQSTLLAVVPDAF
jgi:hypothetical protein